MGGQAKGPRRRIARYLKIGWLCFWAAVAVLVVFLPVVVTAILDPSQRKTEPFVRLWYGITLKAAGVKTRSKGVEKIEQGHPYAIISNHQSHFDILALLQEMPLTIRFVAKKEIRKIPLFGYAVEVTRCIFVDRSDSAQAVKSLQEGIRGLPPSISMLFFAEGTRSPDGKLGPFKKGGFRTAHVAGWPILPVVVRGGSKVLPKGELEFTPGTIEVEVLDPVPREEVATRPLEEIMEDVRQRMVTHLEKG